MCMWWKRAAPWLHCGLNHLRPCPRWQWLAGGDVTQLASVWGGWHPSAPSQITARTRMPGRNTAHQGRLADFYEELKNYIELLQLQQKHISPWHWGTRLLPDDPCACEGRRRSQVWPNWALINLLYWAPSYVWAACVFFIFFKALLILCKIRHLQKTFFAYMLSWAPCSSIFLQYNFISILIHIHSYTVLCIAACICLCARYIRKPGVNMCIIL